MVRAPLQLSHWGMKEEERKRHPRRKKSGMEEVPARQGRGMDSQSPFILTWEKAAEVLSAGDPRRRSNRTIQKQEHRRDLMLPAHHLEIILQENHSGTSF